MNDTPDQDASPQKKGYAKPEFRRVELKADEAVLGFCKSASGITALGNSSGCNLPINCLIAGS